MKANKQVLVLPRELHLPGNEALVRKECARLIIEPIRRPSLLTLLAGWTPLATDFGEIEDLVPEPIDI